MDPPRDANQNGLGKTDHFVTCGKSCRTPTISFIDASCSKFPTDDNFKAVDEEVILLTAEGAMTSARRLTTVEQHPIPKNKRHP